MTHSTKKNLLYCKEWAQIQSHDNTISFPVFEAYIEKIFQLAKEEKLGDDPELHYHELIHELAGV